MVDSPAGKIRGPDRLSADMRQQIDAGAPREPVVKPRKPRKLLVTDLQMYGRRISTPKFLYQVSVAKTGAPISPLCRISRARMVAAK